MKYFMVQFCITKREKSVDLEVQEIDRRNFSIRFYSVFIPRKRFHLEIRPFFLGIDML